MIGLAKELPEHDETYELHRLLGALLSRELTVDEKLDIIGKEYDIPLEENFRKDMSTMCNLSQGVKEEGIAIGRAEGEAGLITKMYKNGLSYGGITLLSLLTHISLLTVVFVKGDYETIISPIILSSAVLVSDILYFFILKFLKQNTYTLDILLITLLNMSVIFQSCFGGVGFALKHFIFSILALSLIHI